METSSKHTWTDSNGNIFIRLNYFQISSLLFSTAISAEEEEKLETDLGLGGLFNVFKRKGFGNIMTCAGLYLAYEHLPNFKGDGAVGFPCVFDRVLREIWGRSNYSFIQSFVKKFRTFQKEELVSKISEFIVSEVFNNLDLVRSTSYKALVRDHLVRVDGMLSSAEDLYIIDGNMDALTVINVFRITKGLKPKSSL